MFFYTLAIILKILGVVLPLLIAVAYFTLAERKIMGSIQRRRGPNVVGFAGLLQPLADGLKLFVKETILPSNANVIIFIMAPLITFILSLMGWAVIPFGEGAVIADINIGILYLFAVSSLEVYGVITAGWASNSKYPFLGALRSAAQMVSYEVSIGFIILTVVLCAGSLNLTEIVLAQEGIWFAFPLLPMFIMFFISCLAETNRHPFDLPEAEAELVSGYNVEYAAMGFALFFLGEYANMILMSGMTVLLFLGGWLAPFNIFPFILIPSSLWFGLKILIFAVLFIWIRAALPRYRYDQLMRIGWKIFLPLSIGYLLFTVGILISFNWLPA
jgi:NADH-quinone oxidoreductase subunit H